MEDRPIDTPARLIDIHTHMIPSGDDGVQTVQQAVAFCREAARRGTRVLYGTPHVNPELPLSRKREAGIRDAYAEMVRRLDGALELRLGFELRPSRALLEEDPWRYRLDELEAVLVECPLPHTGESLAGAIELAEYIHDSGLRPILAHPERALSVIQRPQLAFELAERGWVLQITAGSMLGLHGVDAQRTAWPLLDATTAVVASDGHRPDRPPFLDTAYAAVTARLGCPRADALFRAHALRSRLTG
jgi:protein-tyrosine phosphatase